MDAAFNLKKVFTSFFIFLVVFLLVSGGADLYYLKKNTTGLYGKYGWENLADFSIYWQASRNLARRDFEEYPVYDMRQKFHHFRYSPFMAFIMAPFGKLGYPWEALFWWSVLLNVLLLLGLFFLALRLRKDFHAAGDELCAVLWGAFFGTLRYYLMGLRQGQTDAIVAFLFVLLLIAYIRDMDILSGVIISLVLQMKLFFLPILVYFLFRGRAKLIVSAAVAFVIFQFIPAALVGFDGALALMKDWIGMLQMSVPSQILNFKNHSIPYAAAVQLLKIDFVRNSFTPEGIVYPISALLTLSSYAALLGYRQKIRKKDEKKYRYFEISALIIASLLFSPIAWEAHFITLIVPIGVAVYFTLACKRKAVPLTALGVYLVFSLIGTDLTTWIPGMDGFRFINIAIGTLFLAAALVYGFPLTRE